MCIYIYKSTDAFVSPRSGDVSGLLSAYDLQRMYNNRDNKRCYKSTSHPNILIILIKYIDKRIFNIMITEILNVELHQPSHHVSAIASPMVVNRLLCYLFYIHFNSYAFLCLY